MPELAQTKAMADKRLFIGVGVNSENQSDLLEVCRKLKINASKKELEVRWSPPENWHITLKFLGDVEETQIEDLKAALDRASAKVEASKLRASGVGAFPEERHARVLWAGVARSQVLLDLQSEVEAECTPLGFPPEDRQFNPHITLARLRNAISVRDMISPFVRRTFNDVELSELILFESKQAGPFTTYLPLHRALLKRA